MSKKTIQELFGAKSLALIEVQDSPPIHEVTPIENYVFREVLIRDMLVFWRLEMRSCMLTGHKGSGKTSIVEQFHHRLGVNLQTMTGNGKTNLEALFGQYVLNGDGKLVWQDGPVTSAARAGHSVLINEFNAIPEDVQIALNDVAHEGSPITLPEAGEQFMPAQGFRIYGTVNPRGANDFLYRGRKEIDAALKERFFWVQVDYGTRQEEEQILLNVWRANCADGDEALMKFITWQLDVADAIRMQSQSTGADAIPEIISTRVLCNWARYWFQYSKLPGNIHLGLQRALTFGCRPEVAYAIHKIVEMKTSVPSPYTMAGMPSSP